MQNLAFVGSIFETNLHAGVKLKPKQDTCALPASYHFLSSMKKHGQLEDTLGYPPKCSPGYKPR
jgi:hypothetical protein